MAEVGDITEETFLIVGIDFGTTLVEAIYLFLRNVH